MSSKPEKATTDTDKEGPRSGMVLLAMRRPITLCVIALALALAGIYSLFNMQYDIFPNLGTPTIYVVEPYSGLDPAQMESQITYNFETQFLYADSIKSIQSKTVNSVCVIKVEFQPGTDMDTAMAQLVAYASRARKNMPAGTLPPFIMRFDGGSLPVGDLIFSSKTRSLGEIQDYAMNNVRPIFATLPGIAAPPPFGSSPRTIVIEVDPRKLREYNLSPEQVAQALAQSNQIEPAGNLNIGKLYPTVPINGMVTDIQELADVPIRLGTSPTVFLKDVAVVKDSTDINTGYALLDGRRTLYIPVTKHSNASTLTVIKEVKDSMVRFQDALPPDIQVSYAFDQSGYVTNAIKSLASEGLIGAFLTGLMVLLFLKDWRSSLVVIINIPLSLLGAAVALRLAHQTINIMTLGGLALAIGILVDESTVTIENIHVHMARGSSLGKAAIEGTSEILGPALLTMLCILAVFIPAYFMTGMSGALFIPLTMAVGFSQISAFFLSSTLVPILSAWFLKAGHVHIPKDDDFVGLLKRYHGKLLTWIYEHRRVSLSLYTLVVLALVPLVGGPIAKNIFPNTESGEIQLHMRAPTGTRIDETEKDMLKIIDIVKECAGSQNVEHSLAYVGQPPADYAISNLFLWSSGPQDGVLQVALNKDAKLSTDALKEKLRERFAVELPDVTVNFEAAGLVDQVLNAGTPTPIQVEVSGHDLDSDRAVADRVRLALAAVPELRDVQFGQPFRYPTVNVTANRKEAGLRGVSLADIGKSIIAVTNSTRYILPNFWENPSSGVDYQVQVQVPDGMVNSLDDLRRVPVTVNGGSLPLSDFASVSPGSQVAEYDRYNMQRTATVTGNLSAGLDLGHAEGLVDRALAPIRATLPRGTLLRVSGQIATLQEMTRGLGAGLLLSILAILLLLAASFESFSIALVVVSNVPAVLAGSLCMLALTGSGLNIESFMGTVMSIGVSMANSVLLITFAEMDRRGGASSWKAALYGAQSRMRPVLMTCIAMAVGMVPMALGLSESGKQTAPLARAVIGGLLASTATTLLVMPVIYAVVYRGKPTHGASLDPQDPQSVYFAKEAQ